jgi:hypothetical protein
MPASMFAFRVKDPSDVNTCKLYLHAQRSSHSPQQKLWVNCRRDLIRRTIDYEEESRKSNFSGLAAHLVKTVQLSHVGKLTQEPDCIV